MRKFYVFDAENENWDDYLTRMAEAMDSVENRLPYKDGPSLAETMSGAEIEEMKHEIWKQIEEPLSDAAHYVIYMTNLNQLEEDYRQELSMEVWKNFCRFNNPRYGKSSGRFTFVTFISIYVKPALRRVIGRSEGYGRRTSDKIHLVGRARKRILEQEPDRDPYQISADELLSVFPEITKQNVSRDDLAMLLYAMMPEVNVDSVEGDPALACEMEKPDLPDPEVERMARDFVKEFRMRPLQIFVFLQNYGFCDAAYERLSSKQLGEDPLFLKICMEDRIGSRHIGKCGVDDKFIRNERDRARKHLAQMIREKGLTREDLEDTLGPVLERMWDELMKGVKGMD